MAQDGMFGDETLPVEMTVSVEWGDAEEATRPEFVGFDEVVIPVEIVLEMTPELRAALRSRR